MAKYIEPITFYADEQGEVTLPAQHIWSNFDALHQRIRGESVLSEHKYTNTNHVDQEFIKELEKSPVCIHGRRRARPQFELPTVKFVTESQAKSHYKQENVLTFTEEDGSKVYAIEQGAWSSNWIYDFADVRVILEKVEQ
jgi:hypothetical protein